MKNVSLTLLAFVALLLIYPLAPLEGHAILLAAAPALNETIHGTAVQVKLRFNARIDGRRSRLMLVFPGGGEHLLAANQPSPEILTSAVSGLVPGSYTLRWQVLAEDGHITRGELPFRAQ